MDKNRNMLLPVILTAMCFSPVMTLAGGMGSPSNNELTYFFGAILLFIGLVVVSMKLVKKIKQKKNPSANS